MGCGRPVLRAQARHNANAVDRWGWLAGRACGRSIPLALSFPLSGPVLLPRGFRAPSALLAPKNPPPNLVSGRACGPPVPSAAARAVWAARERSSCKLSASLAAPWSTRRYRRGPPNGRCGLLVLGFLWIFHALSKSSQPPLGSPPPRREIRNPDSYFFVNSSRESVFLAKGHGHTGD